MARPKKKSRTDSGRARDRHVEPRESFHLSQMLLDALTGYVDRSRPRTTKSAVIRLALEEYLERAGAWRQQEGSKE